jgi:hypothetical protein
MNMERSPHLLLTLSLVGRAIAYENGRLQRFLSLPLVGQGCPGKITHI